VSRPVGKTVIPPADGQLCIVFAVDIAGFTRPGRDDEIRLYLHEKLYEVLQRAFDGSGVPWADCFHEDRGDGTLIVVPPGAVARAWRGGLGVGRGGLGLGGARGGLGLGGGPAVGAANPRVCGGPGSAAWYPGPVRCRIPAGNGNRRRSALPRAPAPGGRGSSSIDVTSLQLRRQRRPIGAVCGRAPGPPPLWPGEAGGAGSRDTGDRAAPQPGPAGATGPAWGRTVPARSTRRALAPR